MAKNNYDPVGTLSIGNVVTTSTILYKSNFKRYFRVSLRATGWLLAVFLVIVIAGIIGGVLYGITNSPLVAIPVGIGSIVATLYLSAKYATDRAVICRLAYQELIDVPETVEVATQYLGSRTWGFLRLSLLISLYLFLVAIMTSLGLTIAVILLTAALMYGFKIPTENVIFIFGIGLSMIGAFLVWLLLLVRYYARWFIAELPLAVEQTRSANFSVGRSNQLSKGVVGRIILVVTIAFLITIPINTVVSAPGLIGQVMVTATEDSARQAIGGLLIFAGVVLNLLSELFVMPFWQIIKAIVYYDLRNRREGGDLII